LLAGCLGRPDWSLADILCVSHVDKINTLMIINSISILAVTATCITLVAFSFAFPLCAGDKKNEEERKERFEVQDSLGFSLFLTCIYFLFFFIIFLASDCNIQ
jgi:hypothetical protein